MKDSLEEKLFMANQGKEIFKELFKNDILSVEDTFLLVLTSNENCIRYGIKYLPDFIELYHKEKVYILLDNKEYSKAFTESGGKVLVCGNSELLNLAEYLNLFHMKEFPDTRIIFLTEKDGYHASIGEFIRRGDFSLEEYVAISLLFLKELKEECNFESN